VVVGAAVVGGAMVVVVVGAAVAVVVGAAVVVVASVVGGSEVVVSVWAVVAGAEDVQPVRTKLTASAARAAHHILDSHILTSPLGRRDRCSPKNSRPFSVFHQEATRGRTALVAPSSLISWAWHIAYRRNSYHFVGFDFMVFASSQVLLTLVAIAAIVMVINLVIGFFNLKEMSEKATVDNTIKRISEQQGLERFNVWMAVRSVLSIVGVVVLAIVALFVWLQ
jgi:hypothetical protein